MNKSNQKKTKQTNLKYKSEDVDLSKKSKPPATKAEDPFRDSSKPPAFGTV